MIKMYGIKNCDTIKKARTWFEKNNIVYVFHDYKTEGISKEKLKAWSEKVDWEILLNKKGTTWRKISAAEPDLKLTPAKALKLLQEHPSMIKRPLIEKNSKVFVGFDEALYEQEFLPRKKK